jgi:tetratricopeptide (TPR) repeat protein
MWIFRTGMTLIAACAWASAAAHAQAAPPEATPPGPASAESPPSQSETDDVEKASALAQSGKAEAALALLDPIIDAALRDDAKDPKAICPGAAVAVLQAFMKGQATITTVNDWCQAMLIKAYALIELKRPQEAEAMLATLIGHDPDNPQYLNEYAFSVRVNGRPEQALSLYRRAERQAARLGNNASAAHWRAVALRGQGYVHIEQKRWDEATKAYKKSLKYEPDNDIAKNELQFISENRAR